MSRLRIGTCSWKYPSWEGLVYSAADGINYLEEYSRRYDTVEVDQWFWSLFGSGAPRLPRAADVEDYRNSVPDDFRFTVKAPNAITLTHHRQKTKSDPLIPNPHFLDPDLFIQFLFLLDRMPLGPIILQFGYLNRQHIGGQDEFLRRLGDFFDAVPMGSETALEIRNPKWLNAAHFEFIASRDLVPVLLQGYWMPPVTDVYEEWRHLIDQCGTVVIRLHGPDREGMEKETGKRWDKLVVRRDEELAGIVVMIEELLAAGVDVYLAINNHFEGCGPLSIERVQALLGVAPPTAQSSGGEPNDGGREGVGR